MRFTLIWLLALFPGAAGSALADGASDPVQPDYTIQYRSQKGGFCLALPDEWGAIEAPDGLPFIMTVEAMFWHEPARSSLSLVRLPLDIPPSETKGRLAWVIGQLMPGYTEEKVEEVQLGERPAWRMTLTGDRGAEWGREHVEVTAFRDRRDEATWLMVLRHPEAGEPGTAAGPFIYPTFSFGPRPHLPESPADAPSDQ